MYRSLMAFYHWATFVWTIELNDKTNIHSTIWWQKKVSYKVSIADDSQFKIYCKNIEPSMITIFEKELLCWQFVQMIFHIDFPHAKWFDNWSFIDVIHVCEISYFFYPILFITQNWNEMNLSRKYISKMINT